MTTYLDNCGDGKEWYARCQQLECCKREAPHGFPNAVKKSDASFFQRLFWKQVIVDELGNIWLNGD